MTSNGSHTFGWDERDHLVSITGIASGGATYDSFGRRRTTTSGSMTTQYLYDRLNPIQELSGGSPTSQLLSGLTLDEVYSRIDASGTRDYLTDALGSSLALADGTGSVQTTYTYDPFGSTTSSGASTASSLGFTGREMDGGGLYYYRARYYDPTTGRFLSEDPIGFAAGTNLYSYTNNSPTNAVDPLGLWDIPMPFRLGLEWLTGRGQRARKFYDGDEFAELLRQHYWIQQLLDDLCKGRRSAKGRHDYDLDGLQGVPKYINDYSTLLSFGLAGNLAVTFLGSYDMSYVVVGDAVSMHIWNTSTVASGFRPPVIGYTEWWSNNVAIPMNKALASGPMSKTRQDIWLRDSLAGRGCGC